jgi:hypothetical protein
MKTSQTITKIASALLKAQGAMGTAIKDAKNPFFKSKYADLNSIREACMPSLQTNGITLLQPTITIDGKNYVETILIHESGEWMSCETEILFGKKDDAQAQGSGITYARRYGMQSFLNVGADDDDGNTASQQAKPQAKPFLERGTIDFTNVTNALLQGKATIDQVKAKFQLLEPMENELLNLKVKK